MQYIFYKNFINQNERIILYIGGGGKKTLIHRISQDCKKDKKKVLILSLFPFTTPLESDVIIMNDLSLLKNIEHELNMKKIIYLGKEYQKNYIEGFSLKEVKKIVQEVDVDHIFIKGDYTGKRRSISSYERIRTSYPFKIDRIINIIGSDSFNQTVNQNWIVSKDIFWKNNPILSPYNIVNWLKKHPVLNVYKEKSIPSTYFINKVENIFIENLSIPLAKNLKLWGIDKVIIGSIFNSNIQIIKD